MQRQLLESGGRLACHSQNLRRAVEGRLVSDTARGVIQRAAVRVPLPARGTWRVLLRLSRCTDIKLCVIARPWIRSPQVTCVLAWHGRWRVDAGR